MSSYYYALVGGARRHMVVILCVCVSVCVCVCMSFMGIPLQRLKLSAKSRNASVTRQYL